MADGWRWEVWGKEAGDAERVLLAAFSDGDDRESAHAAAVAFKKQAEAQGAVEVLITREQG